MLYFAIASVAIGIDTFIPASLKGHVSDRHHPTHHHYCMCAYVSVCMCVYVHIHIVLIFFLSATYTLSHRFMCRDKIKLTN